MDTYLQLFNTGAVGVMLWMVWRLMVLKDRKSYTATKEHKEDLKQIHASNLEVIQEVTTALVNKNHTDEKMAEAVNKLAEQLRQVKDVLKENKK